MLEKFGVAYLFVLLTVFAGCESSEKKEGVQLSLKMDRELPVGGVITALALTEEGIKPIDTLELNEDGSYQAQIQLEQETFVRLDIARQGMVNLILRADDDAVSINLDKSDVQIEGSDASKKINEIDLLRAEFQSNTRQLDQQARQATQAGDEATFQVLLEEFQQMEAEHNEDLKSKVEEAGSSLVALYGLNFLKMDEEMDFFGEAIDRVEKDLPDHFWLVQMKEAHERAKVLAIGEEAPDFSLPTPEGKEIALSDLRGKYVLIDFWAAWCGPCRKENPNVVRAYQRFAGDGFEILGVSLDRTREAWLKAIEDDGLPWLHVSDLKYFNSEAAGLYQINAIPATYLIDPQGNILAKNLRGNSLTKKLEDIFAE